MIHQQTGEVLETDDLFVVDEATFAEHAATWVSNIVSPPMMAILCALLVATTVNNRGWTWATLFIVLSIGLPMVYLVWLLSTGSISDIHVPLRQQRIRPYMASLIVACGVLILFLWWPAPQQFQMLAYAFVLQAALFLLITLRWKISLHSAAASNLAVIGWLTVGLNGLALALIIPVVAWARVHLRRHTLAQTVGGALLGVVVVMTALWLTNVV